MYSSQQGTGSASTAARPHATSTQSSGWPSLSPTPSSGRSEPAGYPVVLGGDCTITLGVVAGLQRVHDDVQLAYFDGDADLSSPERTRSGILDATGIAHLLGIADTPLARIGRTFPMLAEHQLVLLGYDRGDPDSYDEGALAARPALRHFSDAKGQRRRHVPGNDERM